MIDLKKCQKTGKVYPILLILFIFVVIAANIFKSNAMGGENLDFAPLATVESKETLSAVEKTSIEIATSFAKSQPTYVTPKAPETPKSPEIPTFRTTNYISSCTTNNCFTSVDANNGIVQYRTSFYYGHSSVAFSRLKSIYVGNLIKMIDKDGVTHTYRIDQRLVRAKTYLNGAGKTDGFTSGIYNAKYNSQKYSAAFMTCGNGSNNDSNYRLILFATEV